MQINNFQILFNKKICPVFYGCGCFGLRKEINNKGLSKDSFKKSEQIIDIDTQKPAKKSEITKQDNDIELDDKSYIELLHLVEDNKNLTLDTDKNLFEEISKREYDIPQIMLIAARNSIAKNGNSYVYGKKTPQLFEGLDKKEIADKITEVVNKIFWNYPCTKNFTFAIKNKRYFMQEKGSGFIGRVYKIFDENGNKAAIKYYSKDLPENNGATEIATLKQMTSDGVKNVPEFYMANASDYNIDSKNKPFNQKRWMLYEFIDKKTPNKKEGISWKKWCRHYGLKHGDSKGSKQYVGRYLVDVGGISHDNYSDFKNRSKKYEYLKKSFRQGMTVSEILT